MRTTPVALLNAPGRLPQRISGNDGFGEVLGVGVAVGRVGRRTATGGKMTVLATAPMLTLVSSSAGSGLSGGCICEWA